MTIAENIKKLTIEAMKAKDPLRTDTLRGLTAGFVSELTSQKRPPNDPVTDEIALAVIKRQVKQRKDSIEQFTKGGRPELADKEKLELTILESFLPAQMSEEEIEKIVSAKMTELGVTDKSGMGKLMGAVMKETGGNADGAIVKKIIESKFN